MKVLVLYDYPPSPGGLSTQGDLLYKGLQEIGIDVFPVHFESPKEKEWYYRWFQPDVAIGVGYWGHTPHLILHPQEYGIRSVPWLVADGFIANYQDVLNKLPLILVTSHWVKEMYIRDGIDGNNIEVLPIGCDTDVFKPYPSTDKKVLAVREEFGIDPDELMILTIGGDAASKGAREVMHALARIDGNVPSWKYVCKVWPQRRTERQNAMDLSLARELGIEKKVVYAMSKVSREFTSFLLSACDIYAAPSRLEGFGMPQVEAGACGKPVIGLAAMGMLDTLIHEETALLAKVDQKIVVNEVMLGIESGFTTKQKVTFASPRIVDYRASISDIEGYLRELMINTKLRDKLGQAARKHVVQHFHYRTIAKQFIDIIQKKFEID